MALENFKSKTTKVWVTFQRKGIHRYPAAATEEILKDVDYLGYPHRHLFKFKVSIDVFHNDRDIEFHQFLNWLESLYDEGTLALDYRSCEMISDDLAAKINDKFPNREVTIDVSEDGEVGSYVVYKV